VKKKILIIGGGISGLAAGCYGQMNGYQTEIYEMHDKPGGLCTSWKRGEYIIDGCIHWLTGSNPESWCYEMWRELGSITESTKLIQFDEFYRVEGEDGRTCILYSNPERLKKHLLELSPEDKDAIEELIRVTQFFAKFPYDVKTAPELLSFIEKMKSGLKMLPFLKDLMKYSKMTMEEFASRFKDPLIRDALLRTIPAYGGTFFFLFSLALFYKKDAGYPLGGSLAFSNAIAKRYKELGGKINYNTKVDEILISNNSAIGLRLSDETEVLGDYVLPSVNAYVVMNQMLKGQYIDPKLKEFYETLPTSTALQVSLGVDYDFAAEPPWNYCKLNEPFMIGEVNIPYISFKKYNFDPTLSPKGKTVVVSTFDTSFDYWQQLVSNRDSYEAEKKRIVERVILELNRRYPETEGKVEVADVATPMTYSRYTDSFQGAYMSWLSPTKGGYIKVPKTLPNLDHLYMIGQWTNPPGGLPSALITGRWAIEILCKNDDREFVSVKS
jgi:phytoene dehydrogenase-like protein